MTVSYNGANSAHSIPDIASVNDYSVVFNFTEKSHILDACVFSIQNSLQRNGVVLRPYSTTASVTGLFYAFSINAAPVYVQTSTVLDLSVLYHAALVREGANGACYINGVLAGSNVSLNTVSFTAEHIHIGNRYSGGEDLDWANTNVSEFAIYNAALSGEEVSSMAKTKCPITVRQANLIRYIPFIKSSIEIAGGVTVSEVGTTSPTYVVHHPIIRPRHSPTRSYNILSELLLHFNGANGSTTFVDSSRRHTITPTGNTYISTAQSVFGGSSVYFDGSGDYLTVANNTNDFAFGSEDFTIDFRWRQDSGAGTYQNLYDPRPYNSGNPSNYLAIYTSTGTLYVYNGGNIITGPTISAGTTYHIALTQKSGSLRLFVDGTQSGSTYDASGVSWLSDVIRLGINAPDLSASSAKGWMDELRIIKGYAAWTAAFTPPTQPYQV